MSERLDRNTWLGFAAILLWSSTVALARRTSEQVGPAASGTAVYLVAALFLGVRSLAGGTYFKQLKAAPRKFLWAGSILFALYTLALFLALGLAADRTQAIEIGLLNYLWPSLTIVFSLLILRNRATAVLIPGTALALLGVFLVLTQGSDVSWNSFRLNVSHNPVAYALGLLAAVTWALYSNFSRAWGGTGDSGAVPAFVLFTGIAFLILRAFSAEAGHWRLEAAVEVGLLALATALAYFFWDLAMRKGRMVLVVACSYLTPFFSTLFSSLYLHVMPGPRLWIGCLLIIAGSLFSHQGVKPPSTTGRK